jgi:hypothetical protein
MSVSCASTLDLCETAELLTIPVPAQLTFIISYRRFKRIHTQWLSLAKHLPNTIHCDQSRETIRIIYNLNRVVIFLCM